MKTPVSATSARQARSIIKQAKSGTASDLFGDLCRMAYDNPRRTAELVIALAEAAAVATPKFEQTHADHLRAAHAAYARGERAEWVVDGERAYQAQKKRRSRAKGAM